MIRCAGAVALAFILFGTPASAQDERIGEWHVVTQTDRLDAKAGTTQAILIAAESPTQFGRQIQAFLAVHCAAASEGKRLISTLNFSEAVAIGARSIRWRVDSLPIESRRGQFYSDGTQFYLDSLIGPPRAAGETTAKIRNGETFKVEADLPWAGNTLLTFNIKSAGAAFSKIPCAGRH